MPAIAFSPDNPKFTFIRSYVVNFYVVNGLPGVIDNVGNVVHVHYPVGATYVDAYITLRSVFYPWSSNNYSLDFIVEEEYVTVGVDPTHYHNDYIVSVGTDLTPPFNPYAALVYVGGTIPLGIKLPPALPGYWLPPYPV